jgi:serine/threonine protein kinase
MGLAVGGDEEADELAHVADLFPELRVEGRLARGGFGTVFRGEHRRMRRRVALKFLDALLAHSREAIDLFEQEMVSVGSLDHPGIVRAYDAGEREGRWFIVMELVEGLDCGALVRQHGRLPVAEACEIVRQAALALGHAHQRGLVHRDVKPGNLMVTRPAPGLPEGGVSEVKVLDFGLAGLSTGPALGSAVPGESSAPGRLMIGTLEYVAPEQIDHPETTDARADLYSLGATLWRLLTGKPPRRGGDRSLFRQMQRIVTEPIAPLATERPDLPRPLAQLCDRLLALDPDERPATAAELARLLEPWCAGAELARLFGEGPLAEKPFPRPDVLRRQRRLAVFAAATLGLGLLAGVLILGGIILATDSTSDPEPVRRGVLPPALVAERKLSPMAAPYFEVADWESESATAVGGDVQGARLLPDGDLAYLSSESPGYFALQVRRTGGDAPSRAVRAATSPYCFGVSPDTGHFLWAQPEAPRQRHLGRARPDGSTLPGLAFEVGPDFDPAQREELRLQRRRLGEGDGERRPVGFAFVRDGRVPPDTGLRPGDVLIADEGHRWLAPGTIGKPDRRGLGGLWRCRLDDNTPAHRLQEDDRSLGYPLDVTVAGHGVFLLNRPETTPPPQTDDSGRTRRVVRWDRQGFHPCTTDRPIHAPSGLTADPVSPDLFVVEGASLPTPQPVSHRLLHLRFVGPDRYEVRVLARNFGRIGPNGLAFAPDGRRLVLTDSGNRVIVVLKRAAAKP